MCYDNDGRVTIRNGRERWELDRPYWVRRDYVLWYSAIGVRQTGTGVGQRVIGYERCVMTESDGRGTDSN